jgi:DUF4097 and DUF4098 domain-containing protein YvlB
MRIRLVNRTILAVLALLCCLSVGCVVFVDDTNSGRQKTVDETVTLASPLGSRGHLTVETSFGAINVTGADVAECQVEAVITAKAKTQTQAQAIADQTNVRLETKAHGLRLYLEKPSLARGSSVGASFTILVPKETTLACSTTFGTVKIDTIEGDVKADTSFSSITCRHIKGNLDLTSKHGDVRCKQVLSPDMVIKTSFGSIDIACLDLEPYQASGKVNLETKHGGIDVLNLAARQLTARASHGNIDIHCVPTDLPGMGADIETSHGSIEFDTPGAFAGKVSLETSHGKVNTKLPITVQGTASTQRLAGTIGKGDGDIRLRTSHGSITLK